MKNQKDEKTEEKSEHKTEHHTTISDHSEQTHSTHPHNNFDSKKNPWIVASIILGVGVVVLLFLMFSEVSDKFIQKSVNPDDAGTELVKYLNARTGGGVEYVSSLDKGSNLYEVKVKYQGQEIPVYVTKDGKYFVQGAIDMTLEANNNNIDTNTNSEPETPKEVVKSDKPIVEAFVFSYCPYGLQFQKALQPVYDLLKNKADIRLIAIGAMHGEYEKIESLRQICIEKNYGKDKLWTYLKDFMGSSEVSSCRTDECAKPIVEKIMSAKVIDKTKINTCMTNGDGEKIYNEQNARSQELGISGSPTFVINGATLQVSRTAEAIKSAVCSAFNTKPSDCDKALSTSSMTPGFGYSAATSGTGAAAANCAV
jgi:protein-disulfide isomerase